MRKTKHLFLALLAVTGFTTAWASNLSGSDPDSTAAKTTYTVQWTGPTDVTYTALPQNGLSASYVDAGGSHNLTLTFTNGTEVITSPNFPVNAGPWTVTASTTQSDITLVGATNMLNIQPAPVYVTGAAAEIAKFADGSLAGVVTDNGVLNGVLGNDQIGHLTTAIFSDFFVGTGKTITLYYALVGDDSIMLNNYLLTPSSAFYTNAGIVIPNMLPDLNRQSTETTIADNGLELNAFGYCTGTGYSIAYHLISGTPDEYRVDFDDNRITDVNWTALSSASANGTVDITLPATLPTGDYTMNVIFRDSQYPGLESTPLTVNIHVNLPETYTMPLFDNVIALVDTCNCFTDIQWYHRANAADTWAAIPGANGYYYREEGGLTGEYFVRAKMNGVETFTCPQTDMATLISDEDQAVTVNAYPNPTTESVNVTINGSDVNTHTLRVISTLGAEMESRTFEGQNTTIDMRAYQHGSYMVNVDGIVVRVIRN